MQLRTQAEFEAANGVKAPAGKRYFQHTRLHDIIGSYPFRSGLADAQLADEKNSREAFLDFLLGVLVGCCLFADCRASSAARTVASQCHCPVYLPGSECIPSLPRKNFRTAAGQDAAVLRMQSYVAPALVLMTSQELAIHDMCFW